MNDAASPKGEAYDLAACGLVTLEPKGRIALANRLVGEWAGAPSGGLIGRPFTDLFVVGSRLFLQTQWWPLLEMQGSVAEVQLELQRDDPAPLPVLVNAVRRLDRHIDVAIFIAADRRKYERELLHARRRAEELVDALAAREAELKQRAVFAEQLIGIVSHDIRNPLNAILLGTELLAAQGDAVTREATVRRIANAANRATRLTNELLDFTKARLGGGLHVSTSEVDIHAVVAETVEELRLAWPGRELVLESSGAGTADVDADRVAQVVTNLVANAMAYGTKDRPITVTSVVDPAGVALRVHNDGRPVPPELQDRIFEPLQRGEEQVQRGSRSVGLGLYIVREIARAHGGEARVESTSLSGTTFEVVLPRASR